MLLAVGLVVLIVLAYLRAVGGEFLWDDDLHVSANPVIIGPLGLAEIWSTGAANYFPLVLTNFWLQHALWGLNPIGYHLVTLSFHIAASLLLWRLLAQLRVPGAWLGAALWALHPVQVESVAWICELKNTQSAVFFLLAALFWLHGLHRDMAGSNTSGSSPSARSHYVLALVCAIAALLSKPSTVMLPVVLLLISGWEHRRLPRWRELRALIPFFALSALMSGWTIWEQKFHSGAVGAEWNHSWLERMIIAGRVIWFYLENLAWPGDLSFIYPRWTIDAANPLAFVPLLLVVAGIAWLVRRRANFPGVLFATLTFVALLFPVLGFFDVYFFRYSYVGDHFQYLASMGPLALLAAGIATVVGRALPAAGTCAVLALTALSAFQSGDYRNRESLWRATVARNPESAMAWTQLGSVLGQTDRHREAVDCFQRALRLNPNHPEARNHLGIEFLLGGRAADAVPEFEKALAARAEFPEAHLNLGLALLQTNRPADALPHFEAAARGRPFAYEPHFHMAKGLAAAGRFAEAVTRYETALKLPSAQENPELHHQYANLLREVGRGPEALAEYKEALRLAPEHAETHDDFGLTLAASGRADEAAAEYQRALQLKPGLASAHNNLGVILAQSGRIPDALTRFDEALRLEPNYPNAQMNRGMALTALQRLPEASEAFARAVHLEPSSAKAHAYLAQVLHALGRETEAQAHLATATRLETAATPLRRRN